MKISTKKHLRQVLSHLYINPLEMCNLRCKICYTKKTAPILKEGEILDFIGRYRQFHPLEVVTFCGGEVFTLPYFPGLVNKLTYSNAEVVLRSASLQTQASLRPAGLGIRPESGSGSSEDISSRKSSPRLDSHGLFIQIITNGTVDRLEEIENPNMVNLIVSLDGLEKYHDSNRGKGNFVKSMNFLKKARRLGFHAEIFTVVTKQNYDQLDEFERFISAEVGSVGREALITNFSDSHALGRFQNSCHQVSNPRNIRSEQPDVRSPKLLSAALTGKVQTNSLTIPHIQITYHPRKPSSYLLHHPVSNIEGTVAGFDFLTDQQMENLLKERLTFPPKELGCYQIALVSDGSIYGCCEGTVPLGKMGDKIEKLFQKLEERLELWDKQNKIRGCLGCSQPDFVCGIKQYIG